MMRASDGAAGKPSTAIAIADALVTAISTDMEGKATADDAIKQTVKKARAVETNKGEAGDLLWGAGVTAGYYEALAQLTELIDEVMKEVEG